MPESRSELTMKIAKWIARKRLRGQRDLRCLICDAVSTAWELERRAKPTVTAASIAWKAVQRVRSKRVMRESIRSISSDKFDRRSKRPDLKQTHIRLTDLASRDTSPSDSVPGWIDFKEWLSRYDQRKRAIATALAVGWKTGETAKQFGLTAGRIAQYRREFEADYADFQS